MHEVVRVIVSFFPGVSESFDVEHYGKRTIRENRTLILIEIEHECIVNEPTCAILIGLETK